MKEDPTLGDPYSGYLHDPATCHWCIESAPKKKEEPMRIGAANVVVNVKVTQVSRALQADGSTGTRVAVAWPKGGHRPPEPGERLVVGWLFGAVADELLMQLGPSPEEQAVIREAGRWYDRMVAMYGPEYVVEDPKTWVHDLAVAVKAMKGGR